MLDVCRIDVCNSDNEWGMVLCVYIGVNAQQVDHNSSTHVTSVHHLHINKYMTEIMQQQYCYVVTQQLYVCVHIAMEVCDGFSSVGNAYFQPK